MIFPFTSPEAEALKTQSKPSGRAHLVFFLPRGNCPVTPIPPPAPRYYTQDNARALDVFSLNVPLPFVYTFLAEEILSDPRNGPRGLHSNVLSRNVPEFLKMSTDLGLPL